MSDVQKFVCRAADEFRAADCAISPQIALAHREIANELIELIKCDGNVVTYRMLRARRLRQRTAGDTLPNVIAGK